MTQISDIRPNPPLRKPRDIVLVGFPGVEPLDIAGPMAVFTRAAALVPDAYTIRLVAPQGGTLVTASGLSLADVLPLDAISAPVDTILIAGGSEPAIRDAAMNPVIVGWVAERSKNTRRIGSICTGAFILGAAGLLHGRAATTHWAATGILQGYFPTARVDPDAIYLIDGPVCTSAGVTAGIDLALALVEADLGHKVVAEIARDLVLFLHRPGGQRQFSATLAAQARSGDRFAELLPWIVDNPEADLSVSALADRAAMSERSFARRFTHDVGRTPARYVLDMRLDHARRFLETTAWTLDRIAARCGFGTTDTLHRLFRREIGSTPSAYRERFSAAQQAG